MGSAISFNKLGAFLPYIGVPTAPTGAQVRQGYLHLRLAGSDGYVSGAAPVPPEKMKAVWTAYKGAVAEGQTEPSYSGSGSQYVKCDVGPVDGSGVLYAVKIGGTEICRVVVDPAVSIMSTDESVKSQVGDMTGDDDGDGDDDDPTVQ